ncbi:MSMEG_1061 family FMN-dependent PPOX-type flavoprotein [Paraliobacillus sediminis]|uniref:MSMEG_1061 family FMN-dependent PPOX-type flavoprotein n=1 Tax=Paraliobacillus sediminis TaxID=1885916 RepID=UPI001967851B|nr:MSMEG_1061 family FMN-dependent PPOX-type flavoprotein [Paraliobacillus sediminis]
MYVFKDTLKTAEDLRTLIGRPSELVENKVINYLDQNCIDFILKSTFLTLATSTKSGYCDVSPRGDHSGLVKVLNEKQLIIPERSGNKRSDSLRNILSNPRVGILFFIPGLEETLRINGKACLIKDDQLLDEMIIQEKKPLLGIGVEVEECFIHCAKAFKRSGIWEPDSWTNKDLLPNAAKIVSEHVKLSNLKT